MASYPRQRSQRVTVEQLLLRAAGEDAAAAGAIKRQPHPKGPAQIADSRTKTNALRLSVGIAAVVAVGCLTAFAATSEPHPSEQASPPSVSLEPAIPPLASKTFTGIAPPPAPSTTSSAPTSSAPSAPASPTPTAKLHRSTPRTPAPAGPPPLAVISCSARFTVTDSWPGGFTASVGITNTGNVALSPWTLMWTFTAGQQITHGWDGDYSQSGSTVTVHPASYNPTIAPSATVNIGFNASYSSSNPAPTGFTVNGARCARTY